MGVLYNDNDPKVAAWLRELVRRKLLLGGTVDERPIEEIKAQDCSTTSHFFAGIGGWPLALRLAGWSDEQPVWTGSCPCQPFSAAGKRLGTPDKRHLWPAWFRLIREYRPPTIFGEQVASRLGREWLAGVRADLEALGYAVGAADLCAAGVGAPHIRQRLFWVANAKSSDRRLSVLIGESRQAGTEFEWGGAAGRLAHAEQRTAERPRQQVDATAGRMQAPLEEQWVRDNIGNGGDVSGLGDSNSQRHAFRIRITGNDETTLGEAAGKTTEQASPWSVYSIHPCADGKSRRVEPSIFPLAHGVPARVVRLRGYGNAIVPQIAAAFVMVFMDTERT